LDNSRYYLLSNKFRERGNNFPKKRDKKNVDGAQITFVVTKILHTYPLYPLVKETLDNNRISNVKQQQQT